MKKTVSQFMATIDDYPFLKSIASVEEEGVRRRARRVVGLSIEGKEPIAGL